MATKIIFFLLALISIGSAAMTEGDHVKVVINAGDTNPVFAGEIKEVTGDEIVMEVAQYGYITTSMFKYDRYKRQGLV